MNLCLIASIRVKTVDPQIFEQFEELNELCELLVEYEATYGFRFLHSVGAEVQRTPMIFGVFFAVAFALISMFGYYVIRSINGPLKYLVKKLRLLSSGDLTQVPEISKKDNEFNIITLNVRELIKSLETIIVQIKSSVLHLNENSEDIMCHSTNTKKSVTKQKDLAINTSQAMSDVKESTHEIFTSITDSVNELNETSSSAQEGNTVVRARIYFVNLM